MEIVLLSCLGVLIVVLNKPLGEATRRANMAMGQRDYGEWAYRAPLILIGVLLTCLSFFAE